MDIQLIQKDTDLFKEPFEIRTHKLVSGFLRTVWDFSEGKSNSIIMLISPLTNEIFSFIKIRNKYYTPEELTEVKGLNVDEERLTKLNNYLQQDLSELKELFIKAHRTVPGYIKAQSLPNTDDKKISYVYVQDNKETFIDVFEAIKDELNN